MITEIISSTKQVVTTGRKLVLIVTKSGAQVWANADQYDEKADTVSYNQYKAGSEWKNSKTGATGVRKSDANEVVGFGKTSKFDVLDYLVAKGVTPSFNL